MYITDNSKLAHLFNNHYINIVENTSGMPPEFFFLLGFSSQTLTIHRTAGEGRGPSFIPLYHFDLLTNIRHLFATLYVRWLSHIFNCNACVYQTATQWDLPPYWMTIWVIDWWCNVCLLDELILGFCYSDLTLETSGFELVSTITLVWQANRLTKCASHPKCKSGYHLTVAKIIKHYKKHQSIETINKICTKKENFDIPTATTEEINKIIKELDPKKATGLDKIPPKIVKMSANVIDSHLANIINNDITKNVFSEKAKVASVRPIFKKNEREKIENYRPVSILNCFSKVY